MHTPTERSQDQTNIGIYWAYDGTPSLCAPPRLYNQIATEISKNETSIIDLARLYALVNTAMADAGIAAWESKFFYDFWRPVGGIREVGSRAPAPRARATGIRRRLAMSASCRSALRLPTCPAAPTSRRRSRRIRRAMRRSAVRCSRPCATSMAGTTSHSPSRRTSSTGKPGQQRPGTAAAAAQFQFAFAGGRGKRPEPHLPRHPLGVRQDRGHRPGTPGREPCVREPVPASELSHSTDRAADGVARRRPPLRTTSR